MSQSQSSPIPQTLIERIREDPILFHSQTERAKKLKEIHARVRPHDGQIEPGKQIFNHGRRFVFLQCGRSWGKSFFEVYAHVRFCSLVANAKTYIVLPELNQARDVMWESGMFQKMIPPKFLPDDPQKAYNKSELRVRWKNNSFIKLMGADNPDSLRGLKPHLVSFDEYRDFKEDVFDIMEPNLGINDATLLIASTPPDKEGHYTSLRDFFLKEAAAGQQDYYYLELPTSTNPYFPKNRLETTRAALIKRGEHAKWLREYEAKFIPGGVNAIFPMYGSNRQKGILVRHATLLEMLKRDHKKLDWYCVFDPATNSVFAVLFAAINRFTGEIFIIDELYERDQMKTGSLTMWNAAEEVKKRYNPELYDWVNVYDEQAAWFYNDLVRHHMTDFCQMQPTDKQHRNKLEDLSMMKDLFLEPGHVYISTKCEFLDFELQNYITDKEGVPQKKDDHLIDDFRYLLGVSAYEPSAEVDPDFKFNEDTGLYEPKSFEQVMRERDNETDPERDIDMNRYTDDSVIDVEELNG